MKIIKLVVALFVFITSAYSSQIDQKSRIVCDAIINVDLYIRDQKPLEEAVNQTNKDLNLNLSSEDVRNIYDTSIVLFDKKNKNFRENLLIQQIKKYFNGERIDKISQDDIIVHAYMELLRRIKKSKNLKDLHPFFNEFVDFNRVEQLIEGFKQIEDKDERAQKKFVVDSLIKMGIIEQQSPPVLIIGAFPTEVSVAEKRPQLLSGYDFFDNGIGFKTKESAAKAVGYEGTWHKQDFKDFDLNNAYQKIMFDAGVFQHFYDSMNYDLGKVLEKIKTALKDNGELYIPYCNFLLKNSIVDVTQEITPLLIAYPAPSDRPELLEQIETYFRANMNKINLPTDSLPTYALYTKDETLFKPVYDIASKLKQEKVLSYLKSKFEEHGFFAKIVTDEDMAQDADFQKIKTGREDSFKIGILAKKR